MLCPAGIAPFLGLLVMMASAVSTAQGASPAIDFNRDIRPLLTEHCYACHGPDAKQRQGGADQSGGLRFDKRESAVAPLGEERYAIVAGDPQRSEMVQRIWSTDASQLIRRLYFDLIGLPPSAEEVTAFVEDKSPHALERVVDRLLGSPHYGERMAIYWLDLVRYVDTVGYHGDQDVSISPYRDYVIDYVIAAFNSNMPFDCFTREQLAGDLLPNATQDQLIASGYNRLGMMSAEGGVQDKEYLAKYAADRDHHIMGFSTFLAGGGTRGGSTYGATDELGYAALENPVHFHDLHATLLHLFGIDHERLTYRFQGRDFRLTDVAGRVVEPLMT